MKKNDYRVPAIESAIRILRCLKKHKELTMSEIAQILEMNKSTCYYALNTLERHSFLEYNSDTKKYKLGIALLELGGSVVEQLNYLAIIKKYIFPLVETMCRTYLVMKRYSSNRVMVVDKLEKVDDLRITIPIGARFPLQGGSSGRCYLAFMDENERESLIREGLVVSTPKSINDEKIFRTQLKEVRCRGFAFDEEGITMGVNTVSAPVFDRDGKVLVVITGVEVSFAMPAELKDKFGYELRKVANQVTQAIGGKEPLDLQRLKM